MAIGVITLLINIVISHVRKETVPNDPWGDGRSLEWSFLLQHLYITISNFHLFVDWTLGGLKRWKAEQINSC